MSKAMQENDARQLQQQRKLAKSVANEGKPMTKAQLAETEAKERQRLLTVCQRYAINMRTIAKDKRYVNVLTAAERNKLNAKVNLGLHVCQI